MSLMEKYSLTKNVVMKNEIMKSDFVIRPILELTIPQRKLIFYLISMVEKDDKKFIEQTISISDYCELFDIIHPSAGGKQKTNFEKSIYDLSLKQFIYKENSYRGRIIRWVDDIKFDYKKDELKLKLHHSLKDFLLDVKERYFRFQLGYTYRFTHIYSYDLYMLFKMSDVDKRNSKYRVERTIETLRSITRCEDKHPRTSQFLERVIDTAIDDINKFSDIIVSYEKVSPKRDKRKIYKLIFTVTKKKGKALMEASEWKENALIKEISEQQENDALGLNNFVEVGD